MAKPLLFGYFRVMLDRKASLFISPAEDERLADEEAIRDYQAGRVVSHDAVKRWLASWGTAEELPRPKVGD